MTRGVKSSEFIVTIIGTVAGVGLALKGIGAGEIIAALSLASAYVAGRSAVKAVKGEA